MAGEGRQAVECSYCGREVKPTTHRREGEPPWEVDYYMLLTGALQKMTMQNPRDESETIEFYKLTAPRWVIACAECFRKEGVAKELEELFSGVPGEGED